MKKGLSILLIAAALFGFYGGSVSLNDVLACKDYWEGVSEKSTADMNKLEDGLNQLKDNEQAYLDGIDQLAEGEKTLAEGEQALAKGESDLAAGKQTLAKGEADYAAAPGKLAAARKKIAAGEKALSDGEDQLDSLHTLIDGIKAAIGGFDSYCDKKSGYPALKDGRVGALKNPSDTSALQAALMAYKDSDKNAASALGSMQKAGKALASQKANSFTNSQYDGFDDYLKNTKSALESTNKFFDTTKSTLKADAANVMKAVGAAQQSAVAYREVLYAARDVKDALANITSDPKAYNEAYRKYQKVAKKYDVDPENLQKGVATITERANTGFDNARDTVKKYDGDFQKAITGFVAPGNSDLAKQVTGALMMAENGFSVDNEGKNSYGKDDTSAAVAEYLTYCGTPAVAMAGDADHPTNVVSGIQKNQDTTIKDGIKSATKWTEGYKKINSMRFDSKAGLLYLSGGVAKIVDGVYDSGNKELISGMEKAAKAAGFTASKFAPVKKSKLTADLNSGSWMEDFYQDSLKVRKGFKSVLPALEKKAKDGAKTLKAGKKTLKSGKAKYAQGLADYKAAPAKLAAGRKALAEGLQKLMDGREQLADGRKQLADGREKLAEYEDGEQQVRDGLATLMSTEPDGGLTSILERRNGDDDFDNGDKHLELDEGLEAVTVGRGYQSDSGVLITKEITSRAVGTAAGLAVGVLAILAALLSFLKKNKGAGVCAVLSAIAGGAGLGIYSNAGTEFSDIAGSTIGNTALIAFGALAGIALVHAIVHFAAKKEA